MVAMVCAETMCFIREGHSSVSIFASSSFFTLGTRAVGPPCIVVTMQKINWLTLLFTLFASYFDKVLAGLDSNWMCVGIDRGDFR